MENRLIDLLINKRYLLAALSIAMTIGLAFGAKSIYFESDYKIFFKPDNIQLVAHELMEETYTKSDGIGVLVGPKQGDIFNRETLSAIYEITDRSWQAPYVMRVDSLTNFQHTSADGEDLSVADLVNDPATLTHESIAELKSIALSEMAVVNRFVSANGRAAIILITAELPPDIDRSADTATQMEQRAAKDASHPEIIAWGRAMIAELEEVYPDLEFHLTGSSVINNSFNEMSAQDMQTLVPLMYLVIVIGLALFLRSPGSLVGAMLVIGFATIAAVGGAGWLGLAINTVSATSPLIILTIAVCDCVHLLMVHVRSLARGFSPVEAMRESLRLNLQPIVLTSVTTAVGFLTLNFAASPPFASLGNITAIGVMWAMILTFMLMPTLTIWLVRKSNARASQTDYFAAYSRFVVKRRTPVFFLTMLLGIGFALLLPQNKIDDDPIDYFAPGVPFRDASEFAIERGFGVNDINFSLSCGEPGCVNSIEYLTKLQAFESWLESQPSVIHVGTYAEVLRRLNKSMNGDDPSAHVLPASDDLAAQYNLLYEMSLPFGLDLNNQVNLEKSSTRIAVLMEQVRTPEIIALEKNASHWLESNYPEIAAPGSSVTIMFAHVGYNNTIAMLTGGLVAILGITLTILIALRSFKFALISIIPNSFPALIAFGIWGVLVGEVNMAVAAVFSISLGIVVDDTVHFISKYRRAREVKKLSPEDSIHYAFANVGSALVVTTTVLVMGFGMLMLSDFGLNSSAGALTSITIAVALVFDFLILPPILLFLDRDNKTVAAT